MAQGSRFGRFLRAKARSAGRQYERARQAYRDARDATLAGDLPTDERGRARIVCRRHAERRRTRVDADGRPACFEKDHPDCEGCLEDVRSGRIETW